MRQIKSFLLKRSAGILKKDRTDGIELTRAIETYKNYVSGADAPKAELEKTEKEIKETFKKQWELQDLLGKGKAGDITKTKEDITGFQTKLAMLEGSARCSKTS